MNNIVVVLVAAVCCGDKFKTCCVPATRKATKATLQQITAHNNQKNCYTRSNFSIAA